MILPASFFPYSRLAWPGSVRYQLNRAANCRRRVAPAALFKPKLELEMVRQLSLWAVRNGTLNTL
jgi:hypothetical protein